MTDDPPVGVGIPPGAGAQESPAQPSPSSCTIRVSAAEMRAAAEAAPGAFWPPRDRRRGGTWDGEDARKP